jgi:hypothetical protein
VKTSSDVGRSSFLPSGRQRLRWWLGLIEWIRPRELQITLVLAGAAGFFGAVASLAFRRATEVVHWLLTGNWEELSESFAHLPAWQRVVVPTAGGAAAGLVLMFTARFVKQSRTTDYMEAVVIGDGILSTRQSLLKSLSSARFLPRRRAPLMAIILIFEITLDYESDPAADACLRRRLLHGEKLPGARHLQRGAAQKRPLGIRLGTATYARRGYHENGPADGAS